MVQRLTAGYSPVVVGLLLILVAGIVLSLPGGLDRYGLAVVVAGCVIVGAHLEFQWRPVVDRWRMPQITTRTWLLLRAGVNALVFVLTLTFVIGLLPLFTELEPRVVLSLAVFSAFYAPYCYWVLRRRYVAENVATDGLPGARAALRYVDRPEVGWQARVLAGTLAGPALATAEWLV